MGGRAPSDLSWVLRGTQGTRYPSRLVAADLLQQLAAEVAELVAALASASEALLSATRWSWMLLQCQPATLPAHLQCQPATLPAQPASAVAQSLELEMAAFASKRCTAVEAADILGHCHTAACIGNPSASVGTLESHQLPQHCLQRQLLLPVQLAVAVAETLPTIQGAADMLAVAEQLDMMHLADSLQP